MSELSDDISFFICIFLLAVSLYFVCVKYMYFLLLHSCVCYPLVKWSKAKQQQNDIKGPISLNEAIDMAQNRPLFQRLLTTFGATHSYWCIPEKKEVRS